METIKTLHIVGFKNSGKTTLISRWIERLKTKNYTVSVIKHHGHGSKLAMPDESKDSMQYILQSADASFVSGGGYTQQIFQMEMDYKMMKRYASVQTPDIILVEGYKKEHGPKVVLVRTEAEWEQLKQLEGIILVIGEINQAKYEQIPSRECVKEIDEWLLNWINSK